MSINQNPTKLALARKAAGLTRQQLSEKSHVSAGTIANWEQRRCDIGEGRANSVLMVAKALDCNVEDILEYLPEINMSKKYSRPLMSVNKQKKAIDSNLKKFRIESGFSVNELSKITGLQFQAIESYEIKRSDINAATARAVFALSRALNVPYEEILK